MALKATIGGTPVEVFFTPSLNIKTTDKRIEQMLRETELEVFDPWEMRLRTAKVSNSLRDAYLIIDEYRQKVPEVEIKITEAPEVPSSEDQGTDKNPIVH